MGVTSDRDVCSELLQVYRDTVLDLLNESEEVSVKEDNSGHVVLDGLTEVRQFEVLDVQQAWTLSRRGARLPADPAEFQTCGCPSFVYSA